MLNSRDTEEKDKHTKTKLVICIIIIIIIILLLITSCTSSFWGKIGSIFDNKEYVVDKDKNDKRENINRDLTFDIKEGEISLDDSSFKITYSYKNIDPKNMTCSTSDADIATCVVNDGYVVINPKKAGKITVTISTDFNDIIYKATCDLTIKEGKKGIKLSAYEGTIFLSNSNKKNVAYNLVGIKGKVDVKVENEKIAKATAKNGVLKITALKEGSTKIVLSLKYGDKVYEADYYLTVESEANNLSNDKDENVATKNKLKLNVTYKQMYVKETFQIKKKSGGKIIKYLSTDKKIATVNSKGKITAKAPGTVIIYVYDNNGNQASLTVNVIPKAKNDKLQLSVTEITLKVGEKFTPIVIKGKADRWVSSNKKIAKVDKKTGKITAVGVGTTTITASDFWYFGNKAIIKVNVVDDSSSPVVPKENLVLDTSNIELVIGNRTKINVTKGQAVSWVSSNESVVKVNNDGTVTAVGKGTATITVTGVNGEKVTVTVTVNDGTSLNDPDKDIILDKSKTQLTVGDNYTIPVTQGVANTWSTSDSSVVTVDNNGNITAKKSGTATITVAGKNGSTDSITLTVLANKIELSTYNKDLYVGEKFTPTIKNSNYESVVWSSSNENVVKVNPSTGEITAVGPGSAVITATNASGIKTEMTINVSKYVLEDLKVKIDGVDQSINYVPGGNSYVIDLNDANANNYSIEGILPNLDAYKDVTIKYEVNGTLVDDVNDKALSSGDNIVKVKLFTKDQNGQDVLANEYVVTIKKPQSSSTSLSLYHGSEEIKQDETYKVGNKENPISLTINKALGSTITKVTLTHDGNTSDITSTFTSSVNPSLDLEVGVSTLTITVVSEDGKNTVDYTYTLERLESNITVAFDPNNLSTLDIDDSPHTLGFSITADGLDYDYDLDDVTVLLDGVETNKVKVIEKGIIEISPSIEDIGDHVVTLKYKGEEANFNIKITEKEYYINTCPNGNGKCDYTFEADYSSATKTTTIPLYTNILKYSPKKYSITTETDGDTARIILSNTDTYDRGKVVISYNKNAAKITVKDNSTPSDSYVLDVLLLNGEDVNIKLDAYRFDTLVKSLDSIVINVTKKYLLTLYASPYGVDNTNYFLDAENRKEYKKFLNENEEFDLRTFDPYQVDDTVNCYSYKFRAWTDKGGHDVITKDQTATPIKLTKDLELYASYLGTSEEDKSLIYAYMDLQDLELFKSSKNSYKDIDEKLIYPGLSGGKGIKIKNNTGEDISIIQFIIQEDTLCVENGACLNMGYKIRKYVEEGIANKYYYGSANADDTGYTILYKDRTTSDIDSSTYTPYHHTYREIDLSDDEKITIPKDGEVDIAVFWKWVDDDVNDVKIGNKAFDINKYKFFMSIKYERPRENCKLNG